MDSAFELWGVCRFCDVSEHLLPCRAQSRLPQNAESVITVCFPYLLDEGCYRESNISKYAVVCDYHIVAEDMLTNVCRLLSESFPQEQFVPFADNSPIPEVQAAVLSGLGKRGLNSLLITPKYGSYVFIGEIVTTMKIEPADISAAACIACGKCIAACPAGAISKSGVDRSKCLSEITQKKGELTPEEKKLMLECGCVWGCDICQDVCPINQNAAVTDIKAFIDSPVALIEEGCSLEGRAYEWRGRKVIERNLALHKTNLKEATE